jgi:hypothetical protein
MNKPVKIAETVGDVLDKMDEPRVENMRVWNALAKTDPAQTKQFKRAGGFSGTAIKPMWVIKRLTEHFGPCGEGWGIGEPAFQVVPGDNREVLVFCTVTCWHGSPGNTLYGVGGDKVVTHIKANQQYNRPERWENDDEAFKKAFTDAVNNAFKFVGVAADIHMGLFDDSKYVREVAEEFKAHETATPTRQERIAEHRDDPFPQGPAKNKTHLKDMGRALWRDVEACGDPDELQCLLADKTNVQLVNQIMKALPQWWDGGTDAKGETFEGLEAVIARKRRDFEQLETTR